MAYQDEPEIRNGYTARFEEDKLVLKNSQEPGIKIIFEVHYDPFKVTFEFKHGEQKIKFDGYDEFNLIDPFGRLIMGAFQAAREFSAWRRT